MTASPSDEIRRLVSEISGRAPDPAPRWSRHEDDELHRFQIRAYLRFASLRLEQNRTAEAAAAFNRVLELDPGNSAAHRGLGDIAHAAGQGEAASRHYRRARQLGPMHGEPGQDEGRRQRLSIQARLNSIVDWSGPATSGYAPHDGRRRAPAPPAANGERPPSAGAAASAPASPSRPRESTREGRQASASGVDPLFPWEQPVVGSSERPVVFPWDEEDRFPWEDPYGAAPDLREASDRSALVAVASRAGEEDLSLATSLADLLVALLEYGDPYYRSSSSLTRLLAVGIGREMGVSEARLDRLALAAVLRDLGRQAVGEKLLPGRPRPGLDVGGQRRMEAHVDLGLELLEGVPLPDSVAAAIRHHHERWDGNGYPDGLEGEQIPLLARILAVADSFSAMIRPRPHRLPRRLMDAAAELRREAGAHFDRRVVAAALRLLETGDLRFFGLGRSRHVVIVHPDPATATVLASKLCSAGYLAEVAADVDAARLRLRQIPVEAVFLTALLPTQESLRFLREMRSDPSVGAIPVLGLDAETPRAAMRLLSSGVDAFFGRNADFTQIRSALSALVSQRCRTRAEAGEPEAMDKSTHSMGGKLEDMELSWLLQMIGYHSRTAALSITSPEGTGVIYVEGGDPRHARAQSLEGEEALAAMLEWKTGRFAVYLDREPPQRTIHRSLMNLLLDRPAPPAPTPRLGAAP